MNNIRKLVTVLATTATVGVLAAAPASAHITVVGPGVTVGQTDATLTFRVPTESDTASTTAWKLQLPSDTPLIGVDVVPIAGWSAKVIRTKLATPIKTDDGEISDYVSEIDWSASAGNAIAPDFIGEFDIVVAQLPDKVNSLTFKAIQNYSDGSTVSWTDIAAPGSSAQPDHPAPVLTLSDGTSPSAAPSAGTKAATSGAKDSDGTAKVALGVGAVGVVLGLLGLGVGLRKRKTN